jgi:Predicted phosphoribosyltransferases
MTTDELKCEFCRNVFDLPELRNCTGIFRDRFDAGLKLSKMLVDFAGSDAVVFGIPAGGVPVAAPVAQELNLALDVVVVSKITLPWNTEVGYGAVAFDGTVKINPVLKAQMGLTPEEIEKDVVQTTKKVQRRFKEFRGDKPFPDLKKRPAILVDDGIASGFTMMVAVDAVKSKGAKKKCL